MVILHVIKCVPVASLKALYTIAALTKSIDNI